MRSLIWLLPGILASLALPIAAAAVDPHYSKTPTPTERIAMPDSTTADVHPPITRHNPSALLDATSIGLSQISVVEAGRMAFLSGQTATRRDGGAIPHDLAGQAHMVADNLAAALKDLKASPHDVVLFRVYVVGATTDRFLEAWSPIRDMLGGASPSMTGIGVQALWTPELQLEVEMVVRVP